MAYWLVDDDGYAGDFASGLGREQMRDVPNTPSLQVFLDTGEATHEQALAIAQEVKNIPHLRYLWALLSDSKGIVLLTDGVEDDEYAEKLREVQAAEAT